MAKSHFFKFGCKDTAYSSFTVSGIVIASIALYIYLHKKIENEKNFSSDHVQQPLLWL